MVRSAAATGQLGRRARWEPGVLIRSGRRRRATSRGATRAGHMTNGPSTVQTPQPSAGTGGTDNTAAGVEPQPWTKAFAAKTPEAFAAAFSEDVTLEATALTRPIH